MEVVKFLLWALLAVYILDAILHYGFTTCRIRYDHLNGPSSTKTQILYLPGILADGLHSCAPLRDTWLRFGDLACVSYGTRRFSPKFAAKSVANRTLEILEDEKPNKLVFILSSMGGILGLDSFAKIRGNSNLPSEVEMIVVDGIQGSKNMLGGGNIFASVMRWLSIGPIISFVVVPIMRKMLVPPKDEDIQASLDKEQVKQEAMAAMSPYKLSIWRDQLSYIKRRDRLHASHFAGVTRVYYLVCTKNNETVRQPEEARKWRDACERARVKFIPIEVKTPHCAYAQMPDEWNRIFENVLSGKYK